MGRLLFRVARLNIMGSIVGFLLAYFPSLIPVKKIAQNRKAVSFFHPSASFEDHVLIISRRIARNIFYLSDEDIFAIVEMAIEIRGSDDRSFVLLINGGNRQDVMQAHFHLYTGNFVSEKGLCKEAGITLSPSDKLFWKPVIIGLRDLLRQNDISDTSFSMFIQFENDIEPSLFFI